MKKTLIAIAIAFLVIGAASAQPWAGGPGKSQNSPGYGRGYGYAAQAPALKLDKISLEGKLELVSGRVAIKQDSKTYFVMIPNSLYGFVPGLVEGATVKVDGYSHAIPNLKDSFAVKVDTLTLGGRTIDLTSNTGLGYGQGNGMMGRQGGMMGGQGGMRGSQGGMRGATGCW
jgi:hypothetical protein